MARRSFIGASFGVGLSLMPGLGRAAGFNGLNALSTAAIPVRNPKSTFLVAITNAGNRLVAVGEHGVIIYSDDNGLSWTQAEVPVSVNLTCVKFATPQLGWAAGHFGVILATADGGKSWHMQLSGVQANQLTLEAAQNAVMQSTNPSPAMPLAMRRANAFIAQGPSLPFLTILILSPQKIIVFGAYRMAMLTTDGGKSWVDWSLHIYDRLSHNIYDAMWVDSNIYLAGEAGFVFCSTDGGDSFLPKTMTGDVTLFGILGESTKSITTFGVAGSCYHSIDACNSWASIALPTQDNLMAGYVLHTGAIVLFSEAGTTILSKDDGSSFQLVPNVTLLPVFDAVEGENSDLIAVGSAGVMRIPTDQLTLKG
jgi:photosystem II stability/assembly factor-like uncharacterized protein